MDLKHHGHHGHHEHHLHRSHAHEGAIPGTVDLNAQEGDDTGYGQALFPVPSLDPNDPLQWPNWKKTMILVICAIYSFLGNSALLGPSVYIGIYAEQFHISPTKASGLISYANLAYGFGSLILVPLYLKIGRRPVMLGSLIFFCAGLIGASQCNTFGSLMACRVLHGFGSGVCEALPVQLVNDIFFLHERGKRLGYYTVALCLGSTGPLYAGYMLAGGYSWRLYFYVEFAFAMALLIMAFLFVEETQYKRKVPPITSFNDPQRGLHVPPHDEKLGSDEQIEQHDKTTASSDENDIVMPDRYSFLSTLKPWSHVDPEATPFITAARSFTYYLVPPVLWVVTTYGIYIGLGALTFNYTFPALIVEPPYHWPQENSGLIAVASALGYILAFPFTTTSDRLAAHLTKKNGGIREAEMRLGALLPPLLISPAGLIVYGFTAQRQLHWIGYFAGVVMCQFGSYWFFTFTLAYAIDSYMANTSEMLIAMNLGKQAISFGMGINLLSWILTRGYTVVISGIFCAILLVNNLMAIVFLIWGKRIRIWMSKSWLARLHGRTANVGEMAG